MSAETLLAAAARERLRRVAGIAAGRAHGMTEQELRTLLETEIEAACVEAGAAVIGDLDRNDDGERHHG